MVKHHAYLQLYPKSVWMVISSETIKEQMFTRKSEPLKAQPTLKKFSKPNKVQNLHLVLSMLESPLNVKNCWSSSHLKQFLSLL